LCSAARVGSASRRWAFDTGRVDRLVANAVVAQIAIEPETVAACLAAAANDGVGRQAEAPLADRQRTLRQSKRFLEQFIS